MIWDELGISFGTAIIVLLALYFVIKSAIKNGIKAYFSSVTLRRGELSRPFISVTVSPYCMLFIWLYLLDTPFSWFVLKFLANPPSLSPANSVHAPL